MRDERNTWSADHAFVEEPHQPAYSYDGQMVLKSYKVAQKSNCFPKHNDLDDPANDPNAARSKSSHRGDFMARDSVIRKFIQERIGSRCSRCFRSSCVGNSGRNKSAACEAMGSSSYVPAAWTHVLKSILMWLMVDRNTYGKLVDSFYANSGTNFGSFDSQVRAQLDNCNVKSPPSSYISSLQDVPNSGTLRISSFPVTARQRCLASLPDLGNPVMLAGLW
jgi:hypothetical protein